MLKPERLDGYLIGGVGQTVTIDKATFMTERMGEATVRINEIASITFQGASMLVTMRDGTILRGLMETPKVINRRTFTFITGGAEVVPGLLAQGETVEFIRVPGPSGPQDDWP
jgi:hypothetical protein